jgi:hypothetical protein
LIFLSQLLRAHLPYTDFLQSMSQISFTFSLIWVIYPENLSRFEALCHISYSLFLRWGVVSPIPNPQLEDHTLLAVHDCLFIIFTATLHICRLSSPSTTWWHTILWWQGTHLTWDSILTRTIWTLFFTFYVATSECLNYSHLIGERILC